MLLSIQLILWLIQLFKESTASLYELYFSLYDQFSSFSRMGQRLNSLLADFSMVEACQDLGGNTFNVIKRCIIPMSLPGVVSGITMVFVPSVSTFYISQKLGGGSFDLIGDVIERQFQQSYNYNLGASLSLVLMVLIVISMAIMNHFSEGEGEMVI